MGSLIMLDFADNEQFCDSLSLIYDAFNKGKPIISSGKIFLRHMHDKKNPRTKIIGIINENLCPDGQDQYWDGNYVFLPSKKYISNSQKGIPLNTLISTSFNPRLWKLMQS